MRPRSASPLLLLVIVASQSGCPADEGELECTAEDTGSLELPASLVTQLLDLGVAGVPSILVARKAVGSTTIAQGRVDLVISSQVERPVEIAGLPSCHDDSEFPEGQACQSDLTCQCASPDAA
ncbi:hypothetical protein [Sorangium sp. So ce1024]|uniref:hypothetical protein n=1 Tax=unclassified Sorangium TaxID=2621164 RepID=UPI003F03C7D1